MTQLITMAEVLFLHQAILEAFGGATGIRDLGMLESALAQPDMTMFGEDLHAGLLAKVAALGFSLIMNHAFVDGNKRVGFAAMAAVLRRQGTPLQCTADEGVTVTLSVAAGALGREQLQEWLESHT